MCYIVYIYFLRAIRRIYTGSRRNCELFDDDDDDDKRTTSVDNAAISFPVYNIYGLCQPRRVVNLDPRLNASGVDPPELSPHFLDGRVVRDRRHPFWLPRRWKRAPPPRAIHSGKPFRVKRRVGFKRPRVWRYIAAIFFFHLSLKCSTRLINNAWDVTVTRVQNFTLIRRCWIYSFVRFHANPSELWPFSEREGKNNR